jgi:hypothetical protein
LLQHLNFSQSMKLTFLPTLKGCNFYKYVEKKYNFRIKSELCKINGLLIKSKTKTFITLWQYKLLPMVDNKNTQYWPLEWSETHLHNYHNRTYIKVSSTCCEESSSFLIKDFSSFSPESTDPLCILVWSFVWWNLQNTVFVRYPSSIWYKNSVKHTIYCYNSNYEN